MLHVGRHSDDFPPTVGTTIADALTDRVFVREVAARRRLADDDDSGSIFVVAFSEFAPLDDPHAHRAEIIGAYGADPRHGPLIGLRLGTPFDHEPCVII